MPLINCKAELKLTAAGADNVNDNDNKIIFTIKDTKLHVPVVASKQEAIKNYQNVFAKDLKDRFIGMNLKQKVRLKLQMNIDIFSCQILLESIDYLL